VGVVGHIGKGATRCGSRLRAAQGALDREPGGAGDTMRRSSDPTLTLCRNCGLTLDWIYQGQMVNLPGINGQGFDPQMSREPRGAGELG
jgi:hypothetical protein